MRIRGEVGNGDVGEIFLAARTMDGDKDENRG